MGASCQQPQMVERASAAGNSRRVPGTEFLEQIAQRAATGLQQFQLLGRLRQMHRQRSIMGAGAGQRGGLFDQFGADRVRSMGT